MVIRQFLLPPPESPVTSPLHRLTREVFFMSFSDIFYRRQIDKALRHAPVINIKDYPRLVLFSDCHRGCGTWNDSFLNNKTIYEAALGYYFDHGFTYVELGDGDELWENRKFSDIEEIHADIFRLLDRFRQEGRLFMLWGNHDRIKSRPGFRSSSLPAASQALIIRCLDRPGRREGTEYNLIHGHQADILNNQLWKLARWLVRYIWKPLELAGIKDPTSAAKNYSKGKVLEERMSSWAKANNTHLIAGHTHRPVLSPEKEKWSYSNTGSCVHPNTITCIEIEDGKITLIKWAECADSNQYIHVCRYIISGPRDLC